MRPIQAKQIYFSFIKRSLLFRQTCAEPVEALLRTEVGGKGGGMALAMTAFEWSGFNCFCITGHSPIPCHSAPFREILFPHRSVLKRKNCHLKQRKRIESKLSYLLFVLFVTLIKRKTVTKFTVQ